MKILKLVYLFTALFCYDLPARAQACAAPLSPFVPEDHADIRIYADLVKADVERYFRCQDQQRRQVFEQARQVGDEYGRVLEILDGDR